MPTALATDPINPAHYKSGGLEAIDVIEAFGLDFCCANAVKYILRAGSKADNSEAQDCKKAIWYLQRRIKQLDKQGVSLNEQSR